MTAQEWLSPQRIAVGLRAPDLDGVLAAAARLLSDGLDARNVVELLTARSREPGIAVGAGVAVPHAQVPGLTQARVALLVLEAGLDLPSPDRRPVDICFVLLAPPDDPKGHLLLLAHIARLCQNPVLLRGLRTAASPAEALALVRAAELRQDLRQPGTYRARPAPQQLAMITISGDGAVDKLLVELVEQGFGDASVIDVQSVRDAVTREVPLFAGFKDLFGDSGGRRVVLVRIDQDMTDQMLQLVQEATRESPRSEAHVAFIPLQSVWMGPSTSAPPAPKAE